MNQPLALDAERMRLGARLVGRPGEFGLALPGGAVPILAALPAPRQVEARPRARRRPRGLVLRHPRPIAEVAVGGKHPRLARLAGARRPSPALLAVLVAIVFPLARAAVDAPVDGQRDGVNMRRDLVHVQDQRDDLPLIAKAHLEVELRYLDEQPRLLGAGLRRQVGERRSRPREHELQSEAGVLRLLRIERLVRRSKVGKQVAGADDVLGRGSVRLGVADGHRARVVPADP